MQAWLPLVTTLGVCASTLAQADPVMGPPIRVSGGPRANEVSAAASEFDPLTIVAGWIDGQLAPTPFNSAGFTASFEAGTDPWPEGFLLYPPNLPAVHSEGDPMTARDPLTGNLWIGAIQFNFPRSIYVARLDPNATEFNPSVEVDTLGNMDKGWMAAGPRPGDPDSTNLYVAYTHQSRIKVRRSDTLGDSWPYPVVTVSPANGPIRVAALPRVGPTGNVYMTYWQGGTKEVLFTRSLDGGINFDTEKIIQTRTEAWDGDADVIPGLFRVPQFPYLAVDPNNDRLYVVYMDIIGGDGNVDLFLITSVDGGVNWDDEDPKLVDFDQLSPGDQFFPWIEVDREGRLHVVFLDTRDPPQSDAAEEALIHAYYMYSSDQGVNWTAFLLTQDPWCSDDDGYPPAVPPDPPTQFIGDYLGMAVSGHRVYPMYLDVPQGMDNPDIYTRVIDFCPADCWGPTVDPNATIVIDDVVGIVDMLELLANWGNSPVRCDIDGDGIVGIVDFLALLAAWGPCPASEESAPLTLPEELADACLDEEEDWDPYVDVMQDDEESQATKDRWDCWMRHYLFDCNKCTCPHTGNQAGCPQPDPFK